MIMKQDRNTSKVKKERIPCKASKWKLEENDQEKIQIRMGKQDIKHVMQKAGRMWEETEEEFSKVEQM